MSDDGYDPGRAGPIPPRDPVLLPANVRATGPAQSPGPTDLPVPTFAERGWRWVGLILGLCGAATLGSGFYGFGEFDRGAWPWIHPAWFLLAGVVVMFAGVGIASILGKMAGEYETYNYRHHGPGDDPTGMRDLRDFERRMHEESGRSSYRSSGSGGYRKPDGSDGGEKSSSWSDQSSGGGGGGSSSDSSSSND